MKQGKVVFRRVRPTDPIQLLPYYLPDNKINDFEIYSNVYPKGTKYPIVSLRNGVFMGMAPTWITFQTEVKIHFLKDEHGVLMSCIPQEIEQLDRQLRKAEGSVLVGGLGLGIASAMLEENPKVTEIVVCEISPDVVKLITPHLPQNKTAIITTDLRDYLKFCKGRNIQFNFAYYDIWRGTGEWDHNKYVIPLREASEGVVSQDSIQCWNEEEMIGQITMGCESLIMLSQQPGGQELLETISKEGCVGMLMRSAFIHYLAKEKPSVAEAQQQLRSYIRAIKQPSLFRKKWDKYNQQTQT